MSASRRAFLGGAAALAAAPRIAQASTAPRDAEPFYGAHQGGIATAQQNQIYFASFDLVATSRAEVIALLRAWTEAAARLSQGLPAQPLDRPFHPVPGSADPGYGADNPRDTPDPASMAADSGEALGMSPARLTITFGFGAGLFVKEGKDRYGLAAARPAALVDMPRFVGDQMAKGATDGDLAIQACADDPQVAFHAIRQLARIGDAVVRLRWVQAGFNPPTPAKAGFNPPTPAKAGFNPTTPAGQTPRNLMGFKDGTNNVAVTDGAAMGRHIWVGAEGPGWMQGGSYLVARRIRIALEHWDRMRVAFQEQTFGRHKISGAPLGETHEHAPLKLSAKDKDGNPVIAENAHVRLAAPESNGGAQILRRSYAFNDGAAFTAERWPPWRQGMEYEAGLFFVAFQSDPRTGFIRIFERMAKFDMLNQFTTHVGSGLFACPGGAKPGEFIGQSLFV